MQDNSKPWQQLKSGFERKINWNKYQSKVKLQEQNPYLDYLTDPAFQGVNRLFVLSYQYNALKHDTQDIFFGLQK